MKKRILVTGYTKNYGGIERTITNLYKKHLNEYVFDFLCSKNNEFIKLDKTFLTNGSKIFYCDTSIKTFMRGAKKFFRLNKNKYESIIVNFGDLTDAFFLKYAKKANIQNRIAYAHMGYYNSNNIFKKPLLHFCKMIIHSCATSLFSYSDIATNITFLKKDRSKAVKKCIVLPKEFTFDNAQRQRLRKLYEIGDNDIVIGCVGSISPNKNQLSLIETIYKISKKFERKITLVLLGDFIDKRYKKQILHFIKQHKDLKIVHIDNQQKINRYYSMFDIYVSASKQESFGLTILESFISGLPIIVNKHSIPKDLVNNTSAIEVDILNDRDVFDALNQCLLRASSYNRLLNNYGDVATMIHDDLPIF